MSDETSAEQRMRAVIGQSQSASVLSLARLALEDHGERPDETDHLGRADTVRSLRHDQTRELHHAKDAVHAGHFRSEDNGRGTANRFTSHPDSPLGRLNQLPVTQVPILGLADAMRAIDALPAIWNIGSSSSTASFDKLVESLPLQYTPTGSRGSGLSSSDASTSQQHVEVRPSGASPKINHYHQGKVEELATLLLAERSQKSELTSSQSISATDIIPRLVNQNPSIRPEQPPSGGCHRAYRFRLMGLGISHRSQSKCSEIEISQKASTQTGHEGGTDLAVKARNNTAINVHTELMSSNNVTPHNLATTQPADATTLAFVRVVPIATVSAPDSALPVNGLNLKMPEVTYATQVEVEYGETGPGSSCSTRLRDELPA